MDHVDHVDHVDDELLSLRWQISTKTACIKQQNTPLFLNVPDMLFCV